LEIYSEHFSVPWHLSSCDFLLTLVLHVNAIFPFYVEKIDTGTLRIKKVLFSQLKCARGLFFEVTTTALENFFPLFWGIRSQEIQIPKEVSQKTGKKIM